MQVKQIVVDDLDGKTLLIEGEDGFIVQGNIYVSKVNDKGLPTGGLIGSGDWLKTAREEKFDASVIPLTAASKKNLLEVLGYKADELIKIAEEIKQAEKSTPKPKVAKEGEK